MNEREKLIEHSAYAIRKWSIIQTTQAGSGHPTTCFSAAEIMATLFFYAMRYDPRNFNNPDNDRFILSKGHAAPALYAVWKEVGVLTEDELMTYRQIDSVLEGHPTLRFANAEAATGSLGIGLSIGVGEALAARLHKRTYYTYVLMGDSEIAEGSVWEAVQVAAHYQLENLVGIVDVNRLGQSTTTMLGYDMARYEQIFTAFGWHTLVVEGHNVAQLMATFDAARVAKGKPVMILAKTHKGHGVDAVEDKQGFHGKPFSKDQLEVVLQQLKVRFARAATYSGPVWQPQLPAKTKDVVHEDARSGGVVPTYTPRKDVVATRYAYGQALAALGDAHTNIVSLDAEVKNSTYAQLFEDAHPERFFQCFVAEQNMVSMAVGFNRRGFIPFASTFGAFFTRAYDQIRMAAIGMAALRLVGSHCGVSIGQDGPSQMALEDIAMMRAVPESVVLYPCDARSTYALVECMVAYDAGISYLRTTRAATPVLYGPDEQFKIGGCTVVRRSEQDKICVIAAGITVFEALKAYDMLLTGKEPIHISIIDLYSVKPFDIHTIIDVATSSCNMVITVEDHYKEGGIGEMIRAALCNTHIAVTSLAVTQLPRSGTPEQLLQMAGIDAQAIVDTVHKIINES